MDKTVIREYTSADVPELVRLWTTVFEDTEETAEKFFAALPDMGGGVAAEIGGEIIGAAYTLNGQELLHDGGNTPVGYLYGIAVYEKYRHRGIGADITEAAYALSKKRGAEIVSCFPAEKGLYAWYKRTVGFEYILRCEKVSLKAEPAERVMRISSAEYMLWRENMLKHRTHIRLSSFALEFEKQLLEEYGGGLYMAESGICAAYVEDGKTLVREVIAHDREGALRTAQSVCALLGTDECTVRLPAPEGEEYIVSDKPLPDGCVWNLTFD